MSVQTLIALPLAPGSLLLWPRDGIREGTVAARIVLGLTGSCLGVVSNILIWRSIAPYRN